MEGSHTEEIMTYLIEWTMFLETGLSKKVDRLLQRIRERLGPDWDFSVIDRQLYWKDKTKTNVKARTSIQADGFAEAVYKTINASSRFSSSCIISSLNLDNSEFDGAANPGTITLPGLYSIAFNLSQHTQDSSVAI